MLNGSQLRRLLANGNPSVAIDRIVANGRHPGPAVRQHIDRQGVVELAARSLAVQRACELLYQPQEWVARAAAGLQAWVQAWMARPAAGDGDPSDDLVAAALAVRGLTAWEEFRRFQPRHGGGHDHGLARCIERLANAVRSARRAGRLSEAEAEAIRWQLQDRSALRPVLAALEGGENGRAPTAEAALAA
jgi:hypothetical protein